MAFGDEASSTQRTSGLKYDASETRKGYTGYEKDEESGLDFAQARYYNTTHGRFTSVDPLTASATIKNPQTFNRYSYVLNSPYKFTDPLGLISSSTGACGEWCPGSGPHSNGYSSNYSGDKSSAQTGLADDELEKLDRTINQEDTETPSQPTAEQNQDDAIENAQKPTQTIQWGNTLPNGSKKINATGEAILDTNMVKSLGDDATEFSNLNTQMEKSLTTINEAIKVANVSASNNNCWATGPPCWAKAPVTAVTGKDGKIRLQIDNGVAQITEGNKSVVTNIQKLVDDYNSLVQKRNDLYTERKNKFVNDNVGKSIKLKSITYLVPAQQLRKEGIKLIKTYNRSVLSALYESRIGTIAGQ
jgi:RHS repeat-associated protein